MRKSGEREIIIEGNKILSAIQNIKLKLLEKPKNRKIFKEKKIGVIDVETYTVSSDSSKIYALGFKTELNDKPVIYYINKDTLDSDEIVLSLVRELIQPRYSYITFYCHNLSGFDVVYILKTLYVYNDSLLDKSDEFKI